MATGDRDFLRDYVRGQPSRQENESVEDYMKRLGYDFGETGGPAPTAAPSRADARADARAERENNRRINREQDEYDKSKAIRRKQATEAAAAAADEAEERRRKRLGIVQRVLGLAGVPPNRAADMVERWQDRIANMPTPGGNAALLALLAAFGAFIIPVSSGGYTRAQLLWLTLLGRTTLADAGAPAESVSHASATGQPAERISHVTATGQPLDTVTQPTVNAQVLPMTLVLPGSYGGPTLPG